MSGTKQDNDIDMSKPPADGEADIAIAEAIPQPNSNEPPIPAGHARFYCSKCHTVRTKTAATMFNPPASCGSGQESFRMMVHSNHGVSRNSLNYLLSSSSAIFSSNRVAI